MNINLKTGVVIKLVAAAAALAFAGSCYNKANADRMNAESLVLLQQARAILHSRCPPADTVYVYRYTPLPTNLNIAEALQ